MIACHRKVGVEEVAFLLRVAACMCLRSPRVEGHNMCLRSLQVAGGNILLRCPLRVGADNCRMVEDTFRPLRCLAAASSFLLDIDMCLLRKDENLPSFHPAEAACTFHPSHLHTAVWSRAVSWSFRLLLRRTASFPFACHLVANHPFVSPHIASGKR